MMLFGFLVTSLVCAAILCLSVPGRCWTVVKMNCYRSDGTFSRRRLGREASAFFDYVTTVSVPVLFVALGLFIAFNYLFSHVIPLELLSDSFRVFDSDFDVWRSSLVEVQREHEFFLRKAGSDREAVQQIQSILWDGWPVFVGVAVLFVVGFCVLMFKCVARSVVILGDGVRRRELAYAKVDIIRAKSTAEKALI